ncbi:MAG TPA: DNA-3-methyladenine glycosylase 2 family protein [Syntrophomonadaceae bacterium]|nr:DNA-3-methyladenine glycosylase 2 family protein [Syntrophomonadaceae bacterium]
MEVFKYGDVEINYLKSRDPILGAAMDRMGKVEREVNPDLFSTLIYVIVGQQISIKAVNTIWDRMLTLFVNITPQTIAEASVEKIQQCGLSTRKAKYIKNAGEQVVSGVLKLDELHQLSDVEVIKKLSTLHGVGPWTAEMLLLNSMERPDIISWGDIAIRRGMMKLYGLSELSKEQFMEYSKVYSPYSSVASIYLWKLSFE